MSVPLPVNEIPKESDEISILATVRPDSAANASISGLESPSIVPAPSAIIDSPYQNSYAIPCPTLSNPYPNLSKPSAPDFSSNFPPDSFSFKVPNNNNQGIAIGMNNQYENRDYLPRQSNYVDHHTSNRRDFIKKVYALLCIQLVWTSIVVAIVVSTDTISQGIKKTTGLVIAALVICLIIILAIMCFKKVGRRYPINYIALFSFSFFESYVVAYVCAFYDPYIVLAASLITLVVAFTLTIYAWKTKSDYTACRGILVSVITSLILFGFFMIFFYSRYLHLIFCEIAIILYSIFIVYDTQLIAGGRYQEISYDDYVIGALILYVDIVGLFLYILSFLGSSSNN